MDTISIGEYAEQMFTVKAILNGFRVSRPIGHASSYDFIIEKEGLLHRIQVKSTSKANQKKKKYQIGVGHRARSKDTKTIYKKDAFDYFAIYIKPTDTFYIIPIQKIKVQTIYIDEDPEKNIYEKFREKWEM